MVNVKNTFAMSSYFAQIVKVIPVNNIHLQSAGVIFKKTYFLKYISIIDSKSSLRIGLEI